jgi:hypothetical protein
MKYILAIAIILTALSLFSCVTINVPEQECKCGCPSIMYYDPMPAQPYYVFPEDNNIFDFSYSGLVVLTKDSVLITDEGAFTGPSWR